MTCRYYQVGLNNIEFKSSEKNWSEYLKKYDQILGGFSTMKISKENFQNYPTHYFSTLGNINTLFNNILAQQSINIENSFQFAFTDEGRFKSFHNTIYSDIDYSEVQRYAENDKVKLEVKNGLVQIDKIAENTQTYLVAILESYGKGKRKQVDSFISDLVSGKFIEKKKEGLSLIFGLNKGYKAFRNKYKTANFEADIKFHLDSKLDHYIIESIYQNVFNSLNNILSFKYIDSLFSEVKKEENKNTGYITYQMIDATIIWKPIEFTLVEKVLGKISNIISKWFPFDTKKNEIELLFKSEIEHFKNEVETEVSNKYKTELEQNKMLVEQLNNIISEKDKTINLLEKQIEEKKDLKKERPITNYPIPGVSNNIVQENSTLFPNDNELVNNNISRIQLEKLNITALKQKAKELKIPNYSTYKKNNKKELIDEILKLIK